MNPEPMTDLEYQRGYDAATTSIEKGGDPQSLWHQAEGDIEPTSFTQGWQDACLQRGAELP